MINLKQTYHLTTLILIVGLLVGPIHYLPSRPPVPSAQAQGAELAASGPYRTHVTFSGSAARARLDELGVVVLDEGPEGAVVLADDEQLETLARLRFRPHQTDSLDRLGFGGRVSALRVSAREILVLVPLDDTDADGLADTEETWWCTDPLDPDSDGDLVNDGAEVDALTDWLHDPRSGRPSSGKPFVGWPPDHTGCYDDDFDSVPDLAEIPIGLNQNLESSDRDKFDDGQELFGNTYCPGGGGACSYGYLPRDVDGGIVPPQMPSWVEAPGNHPLVAAFPEPEIEVVEDSLRVDRVTVITTEEGEMTQETHTYETAVTHGTSSSVADTVTWNEWQEISTSVSTPKNIQPDFARDRKIMAVRSNNLNINFTDYLVGAAGCLWGLRGGSWKTLFPKANRFDRSFTLYGCYQSIRDGLKVVGQFIHPSPVYAPGPGDLSTPPIDIYQEGLNKCGASSGHLKNQSNFCAAAGFHPSAFSEMLVQQGTMGINEDRSLGYEGNTFSASPQQVLIQPAVQWSVPIFSPVPIRTDTETSGYSQGGAQTTTHTEYEEHTATEGEAFTTGENWSTAWAQDTVHSADLRFTYRVCNFGTDYAREITGLLFNIYLGDDPNPIHTYNASAQIGTLTNVMPDECHTYTSDPVALTLDEMRSIDLGAHLYVVVEDYAFGNDELFYEDALNGGVLVAIEDGFDDGDELIDTYVIPTWGSESLQDVVQRYFPTTEDDTGNLLSIWTPEFTAPPTFYEHALTASSWWNIYMSDGLEYTGGFSQTLAAPGTAVLFRMNSDGDLDGYNDRNEIRLNTDPDDPASHPEPAMIAGYTATRQGDEVTVLMTFQNNGSYDAYGVEAVMFAPDDATTIGNNTIGGSGRVRAGTHVVLGSRVLQPTLAGWDGTAQPYATGSYSGDSDKVYTFTVSLPGNVGSGSAALGWTNGTDGGALAVGDTYHPPLPVLVNEGVEVGFDTGTLLSGDYFTVPVRLPRDTMTYTVNADPYTPPVIVVSYNDPQGNHRFITPVELTSLSEDLTPYAGQMLADPGVDMTSLAVFTPAVTNTLYLVTHLPGETELQDGHLFVEYVNISGTVVAEQVFTQTFASGPTVFPVEWSTDLFTETYQPDQDYILMAFFTDAQGNIIDTAARPLSSLQADPLAEAHTSGLIWDFGTATQGALLEQPLFIANTGLNSLRAWVAKGEPVALQDTASSLNVFPADVLSVPLTLDTSGLPAGPFNQTLTIRTSDPDRSALTLQIAGEINALTEAAGSFDISYRPWDQYVYVPGPHDQNDVITFTHEIDTDSERMHPLYVFSETGGLLGVGECGPDFTGQTAPFGIFGDGSDGDLIVGSGQISYTDNIRAALVVTATAGQDEIAVNDASGFAANMEILIIQMQGPDAGNYEFGKIASINGVTLTLQKDLVNTYSVVEHSKAQVLWTPNYRNVSVLNGGTLTAHAWDGNTGGIVVFRANEIVTVEAEGSIDSSGKGFSGGPGATSGGNGSWQGDSQVKPGVQNNTQPNGGGGGGGTSTLAGNGGGGGYGTAGGDGQGQYTAYGGIPYGTSDLSQIYLGSGGGGSNSDDGGWIPPGDGGDGGGTIMLFGKNLHAIGTVEANGGDGGWQLGDGGNPDVRPYSGGGGSGGSILIDVISATLGANLVTAVYGDGPHASAGDGGVGRIRIEYCDGSTGTTNPPASTQQITCYIARQLPDGPTVTELTLPTGVTDFTRYRLQYGQRGTFTDTLSPQTYYATLPKRTYDAATLDALFENLGTATFTFTLDIGADGSVEWSGSGTEQPVILNSPDLSAGLNTFLIAAPAAWGADVTVPILVSLNTPGDLFLTNLALTPGTDFDPRIVTTDVGFDVSTPTQGDPVTIRATVHNSGTLPVENVIAAFFVGDPATDGWLLGSDFLPLIPAGGSALATREWDTLDYGGTQTITVVLDPTGRVAEMDETNNQAARSIYITPLADLTVSEISFEPSEPHLGEMVFVTAVIANLGGAPVSEFAVGFYDGDPEDGGTEIISATTFITGSGATTVTASWLAGPMGTHQIYALADPTGVAPESYEDNNAASDSIFVGMPGEFYADSGGGDDPAYDAQIGYGYLNGQPVSWGSTPTETARWNSGGEVSYRFDYLIAGATYHLDLALYDGDGAGRVETVWVDGVDSGQVVDLGDDQVHWVSIRLDPALYADHSINVGVRSDNLAGAVVSEIAVREIEYIYLDAGPNLLLDPPYAVETGYGYLNGFGSAFWGNTPTATVRTDFGDTVEYRFDGLSIAKDYQVNLTFYEGDSAARQQTVEIDGVATSVSVNLGDGQVHHEVAQAPLVAHLDDGSIAVEIQRVGGNLPVVSEIALEQQTVPHCSLDDDDCLGPTISIATYPVGVASTQSATVLATISDASRGGHGVSQAMLFYGYSYPYSQQSVAGSGPAGNGDGTWTFAIPAQGSQHVGETLRFFLVALDGDDSPASTTEDKDGDYFEITILASPPDYKVYLPTILKVHP